DGGRHHHLHPERGRAHLRRRVPRGRCAARQDRDQQRSGLRADRTRRVGGAMRRWLALCALSVGVATAGTARAQDTDTEDGSGPSILPFVVAGAGVVAIGAGGIFALQADSAADEAREADDHRTALDRAESSESLTNTANLMLLTGGVLLAVGVAWAAVEITDADDEGGGTALLVGPGSLALRGAFD